MRTFLAIAAASTAMIAFNAASAQDAHHPPSGPTAQQAPSAPPAGSPAPAAPSMRRQRPAQPPAAGMPMAPGAAGQPGMMGPGGMMMGQGGMMMGQGGAMMGQGAMMGPGGPMMMMMGHAGMMALADRVEGRIAFLRAELRITDAQQAQWNAFAAALRAGADSIRGARGPAAPMTTAPTGALALLDQHQRTLTARLEAIRAVRPALEQLYAVLSDEQKATLDQLAPMHVGMM